MVTAGVQRVELFVLEKIAKLFHAYQSVELVVGNW